MKSDFNDMVKDLKATVTMDEVLDILGYGRLPRNRKIPSLFKPEHTPSLHVYHYDWYDYSTGRGGDQIDFVMAAQGADFKTAVSILGRSVDPMARRRSLEAEKRRLPDLTAKYEDFEDDGDAWDHLFAWAFGKWPYLKPDYLASLPLKFNGTELWIPHYDGVIVRGIKVRNIDDGSKYAVKGSNFTTGLYRVAPAKGDTCVLVEGESDTWCMSQYLNGRAATVYGLPSGAATWRDSFYDQLRPYRQLLIVLDDDEAGQSAAEEIAAHMPNEVVQRHIAPGGRVAEAFAEGWKPW